MMNELLEDVPGIGELYIYDTSLRIGAKLNLYPKKVYLHAGTRRGARALGLKADTSLNVPDLPSEFRCLLPYEIEDVLCIFKEGIQGISGNTHHNRLRRPQLVRLGLSAQS
jgi:hypothetical protein